MSEIKRISAGGKEARNTVDDKQGMGRVLADWRWASYGKNNLDRLEMMRRIIHNQAGQKDTGLVPKGRHSDYSSW